MEAKPQSFGKKWTPEEENTLLEEVGENLSHEIIAEKHGRTVGGIIGKLRGIAYNLYQKKTPMSVIMEITKLDSETISETISKKEAMENNKKEKMEKKQEKQLPKKSTNNSDEFEKIIAKLDELNDKINKILSIIVKE